MPLPVVEIQGPSAFGSRPARFLHLFWIITTTDFKLDFFGSALGYLWSLVQPLMLFGVLYVVFTEVIRLGRRRELPGLPALVIVLFTFFTETTTGGHPLLHRENLLRKIHFPRLVIPLAVVLTLPSIVL